MKFTLLQIAVLLVSTSLCSPFQFSRSRWHAGSQLFKLQGQSVQVADSDETNTDPETARDVADELILTKSKLKVLQRVVKKMKKKSEESDAAWETRLAQEKKKQAQTLSHLNAIQKTYNGAEAAFADERSQLERQIETLTSSYDASLEKSSKNISDLTKREATYKRDIIGYEAKVAQMEEKIAKITEDRKHLEAAWKSESNRQERILEEQRRKEEILSAELDDVYAERDDIIGKLEETRQRRSDDVKEMELAKISLEASQERQLKLQETYTVLRQEYDATQREMQKLRQTIVAMEENNRSLEEKVQSASNAIDADLQEEIETLKRAIFDLRMHHNSQLKKQQRETETELAKMRDDHYKQVQQFRKTVMERNDSVEKKGRWQRLRTFFRMN